MVVINLYEGQGWLRTPFPRRYRPLLTRRLRRLSSVCHYRGYTNFHYVYICQLFTNLISSLNSESSGSFAQRSIGRLWPLALSVASYGGQELTRRRCKQCCSAGSSGTGTCRVSGFSASIAYWQVLVTEGTLYLHTCSALDGPLVALYGVEAGHLEARSRG